MFTIKMFKGYPDDARKISCFSAPAYEVYERPNGMVTLTIFNTLNKSDTGTEHHFSHKLEDLHESGREYYHNCYIENPSGKTIGKIVPKDGDGEAANNM